MRTDSDLSGILIQETNSEGLITLCNSKGSTPSTANKFATGCILTDDTTGKDYINSGSSATPSWEEIEKRTANDVLSAQEEVTTTGAISVSTYLTTIDTTAGATAYTLANGTKLEQLKKILLRVDGGDATVTGSFAGDNNTLTFSDAGEYALLQWNGTDWIALELTSVLNMAHAPVLSEV